MAKCFDHLYGHIPAPGAHKTKTANFAIVILVLPVRVAWGWPYNWLKYVATIVIWRHTIISVDGISNDFVQKTSQVIFITFWMWHRWRAVLYSSLQREVPTGRWCRHLVSYTRHDVCCYNVRYLTWERRRSIGSRTELWCSSDYFTFDMRPAHYTQMQIHKRTELRYIWDALSFNLRHQ
jgi:hypothetical protein